MFCPTKVENDYSDPKKLPVLPSELIGRSLNEANSIPILNVLFNRNTSVQT